MPEEPEPGPLGLMFPALFRHIPVPGLPWGLIWVGDNPLTVRANTAGEQVVRDAQGREVLLDGDARDREAALSAVSAGFAAERARAHSEWLAASGKATAMLQRFLTSQQISDIDNYQHFDVTSNRGRRWRISTCGQTGNVGLLGEGDRVTQYYCAHPSGRVPNPAAWLAQAVTLLVSEESFLAVANPQAEGTCY